jgi:hypothetical protein
MAIIMKKFALLALVATSASAFAFSPRVANVAASSSTKKTAFGGGVHSNVFTK